LERLVALFFVGLGVGLPFSSLGNSGHFFTVFNGEFSFCYAPKLVTSLKVAPVSCRFSLRFDEQSSTG
jgi:hypothetical protein